MNESGEEFTSEANSKPEVLVPSASELLIIYLQNRIEEVATQARTLQEPRSTIDNPVSFRTKVVQFFSRDKKTNLQESSLEVPAQEKIREMQREMTSLSVVLKRVSEGSITEVSELLKKDVDNRLTILFAAEKAFEKPNDSRILIEPSLFQQLRQTKELNKILAQINPTEADQTQEKIAKIERGLEEKTVSVKS